MITLKYVLAAPLIIVCFFVGTQSAAALTISPVKVEVTGDPGQTLNGELELLNEQAFTKVFYSSFENFEPSGDTGSPRFVGGGEGLATWLSAPNSITVSTGETVKIPYSITIPAEAEAGGYFAAIFWGEQDPGTQEAGEVAIGGKLGVLILLRVAGDIEESAGISEYMTNGLQFLKTHLPVEFSYRFKNDGGDRVVPLGDIVITNTFGGVAATVKANPNEGSVLPDSARKFTVNWGESVPENETQSFFSMAARQFQDFHFGYYKANLSLVYGATNQTAESQVGFIMLPWQLLVLLLIGLVMLVMLFKLYNRWIISKSLSKA